MFFSSEDEDSNDFFNLDEVRDGWSEAVTAETPVLDQPKNILQTKIQWEPEVLARFETLRESLFKSFPDYAETFDVLFQSIEEDLNRWLGISPVPSEQSPEDDDAEAVQELESEPGDLDLDEFEDIEPVLPQGEAGKALSKALMDLENFLEAIFVDGDFWRLMS